MKEKRWIWYLIILVISLAYFFMFVEPITSKYYIALLWTCYIAIPIIIIGLIKKNPYIILSQVTILALTDLLWIFDFICLILLGHTILGIKSVDIFPSQSFILKLGNLQHLVIVPLSIVALSILKVKRNYKTLLVSLAEVSILFLLTLFFVPSNQGINCVHITCIGIPITFLPYYLTWFLFVFGFVILSYFIITSLPFIKKR